MITIETIDTYVSTTEKPEDRIKPVMVRKELGLANRMANWMNSEHHRLLEAAHHARLLKVARDSGPSIDVHRYLEHLRAETLTMVERYVNRLA